MSVILVVVQFAAAAALVITTDWPALSWVGVVFTLAGGGLAVWSWVTMGWRRLSVLPSPQASFELVQHGPYRWIRHPMYSGLLVVCVTIAVDQPRLWRYLTAAALLLALDVKARLEEKFLTSLSHDYRSYLSRTWRFVPGVY